MGKEHFIFVIISTTKKPETENFDCIFLSLLIKGMDDITKTKEREG